MDREASRTMRSMRSVRESLGMTIPDLAEQTGLAQEHIKEIEDDVLVPSPQEASQIADALHIPSDLLNDTGTANPDTPRNATLDALLDTMDENARRFVSDKEIEQLENALNLSIEAVHRLNKQDQ